MTAPEGTKSRGLDPATRGVLVLAVVVVLGLVLLAKASPSSSTSVATPDRPGVTSPTTKPPQTTLATTTTAAAAPAHPAAQVKVLVLNGSGGIPKVAGSNSTKIKGKGYNTLSPGNAVARPTTAVYFAPGYQSDAAAVAEVLGLAPTVVAALPSPAPAPNASQANVVVVLGKDTPPAT